MNKLHLCFHVFSWEMEADILRCLSPADRTPANMNCIYIPWDIIFSIGSNKVSCVIALFQILGEFRTVVHCPDTLVSCVKGGWNFSQQKRGKRQAATGWTHENTCGPSTVFYPPGLHVFGMWEETGVPRGKLGEWHRIPLFIVFVVFPRWTFWQTYSSFYCSWLNLMKTSFQFTLDSCFVSGASSICTTPVLLFTSIHLSPACLLWRVSLPLGG